MARASEAFRFKDQWHTLQQRGMQEDFSWDKSAVQYIKMYKDILGLPQDETPQGQQEQTLAGVVG
jgi:starch synthase